MWIVIPMVAVYYIVHYMFASLTAHATALMPVFLISGRLLCRHAVELVAMLLCYTSGISCLLTPYASGPSASTTAAVTSSRRDFWRLGAIFGIIFLAALLRPGRAVSELVSRRGLRSSRGRHGETGRGARFAGSRLKVTLRRRATSGPL